MVIHPTLCCLLFHIQRLACLLYVAINRHKNVPRDRCSYFTPYLVFP